MLYSINYGKFSTHKQKCPQLGIVYLMWFMGERVTHSHPPFAYVAVQSKGNTVLNLILRMKKNNFNFEKRAIFLVKVVNRSIYTCIRYENS